MARIILRQGAAWRQTVDTKIVNRFHYLTHQAGSHAIWLPTNGLLVTRDPQEADQNFPYETWLQMALYEGPAQPARHYPSAGQF